MYTKNYNIVKALLITYEQNIVNMWVETVMCLEKLEEVT